MYIDRYMYIYIYIYTLLVYTRYTLCRCMYISISLSIYIYIKIGDFTDTVCPLFESDTLFLECLFSLCCAWSFSGSSNRGMSK